MIKVDSLEIIRPDYYLDGFGTTIKIDGEDFYKKYNKYEKVIILSYDTDAGLIVTVETNYIENIQFQPNKFDFKLGELRITKNEIRTFLYIGNSDIKCKTLKIRFQEGEAIWVDLSFLPSKVD